MTERLYYATAPPRTFDAVVERVERREGGLAVWLDRTAFYPTSGGQPHDLGTLEGIPVVDVADDDEGGVVHTLAASGSASPGSRVRGEIDWPRRFDHMQQHTGQHLLSAVLERMFQARTISFHLGTDSSTIDLDRELSQAQLLEGELQANRSVWDDGVVAVRYATADEARTLPLRKESAREGTLRLIDIAGVDLSACGGTHVARTGAIGQIALGSVERFKGGQRVEFLCGGRALRRHQQLREASAASVRLLSVLPADLPAGIQRLQTELKEQKRAMGAVHDELARYQAAALVASAEPRSGVRLIGEIVEGDVTRLKALASAIAAYPGVLAILASRSVPVLVVAARGAEVSLSCQEIVASLARQFGGRGGGKPDMAQCGGLHATSETVLEYARAALGS